MKKPTILIRRPQHIIEILEARIAPAFISMLASTTATFTGDAGADTLTITEAGGLLHHNRAGDPGFASDTDFDTTIAGSQTILSNSSGVINVNGGGGADVFNITYVGNLSVGSINMPLGTANITSTAGSVIMGSGAAAITATSLAVSANSGIGNIASPLLTAVTNLEAQTSTQDLLISNVGNLTIGGVSAGIAGVRALVSGNIQLQSTGSIAIQTGADIIKTLNGNVLVDAIGATSDIQTGGGVGLDRIDSDLGNVTVQAGRDVLLGNPATGFGDIEATGNLQVTAVRDVIVDRSSFVDVHGAAATNTVTAGRNISILHNSGSFSRITTEGGALSITTGADGTLTVDADDATGAIRTIQAGGNGNITISADRINITASDKINAGTGIVTIQPVSVGRLIDLGSATDVAANTLEISDAELDRITASVIRIGDVVKSGQLTVTAAIDTANTNTMRLESASSIVGGGAGIITEANLRVRAIGNVLLSGSSNVGTLAGSISAGSAFSFSNGTNALIIGTVDGQTGLNTTGSNGNITIVANSLNVGQVINAGTGRVTLQPFTATTDINLGAADAAGVLGLTNAELSLVTAGVLQIGVAAGSIDITVSAAISLASVNTLRLISTGTVTDTGAGSLTVANLAVTSTNSVTLDSATNDVNSLAGAVTVVGADFSFRDADDLIIGTVDGVAGITVDNAFGALMTLQAGATTQAAGANIVGSTLQLLGAGPFTLNSVGNDLSNLVGAVTGAVSYTEANSVTVSASGLGGLSTTNSPISITALAGDISVSSFGTSLNAGTSTVSLTAGSAGADREIRLNVGSVVTGTGGVTFTADKMGFVGSVNAGAGTATLRPFESGTLINLGGADAAGTLGLTDTELDLITAGVLRIGSDASGDLTITTAITPALTNTLILESGAQIFDGNGGFDITVANLGLKAGTGIGLISGGGFTEIDTIVNNIEAETLTGGIQIVDTDGFTVGGVSSSLHGLRVETSGDISARTFGNGSITLTDTDFFETVRGGTTSGNVTLTALGASGDISSTVDSDAVVALGGSITLNAGRDILLGTAGGDNDLDANGTVTLTAGRDVVFNGDADVRSDNFGNNTGGSVVITAGRNISITGSNAEISAFGSSGADVTLTTGADGVFTLTSTNNPGLQSASGDVTVNADRIVIGATAIFTVPSGIVTLQPKTAGRLIDLGSATDAAANTLELSDAELDRIATPILRIGSATSGAMTFTAAVSPSGAGLTTLSLISGATITDTGAGSITIANLRATAVTGVTLDSAGNNTGFLAGSVSGVGDFIFNDSSQLIPFIVDGTTGITTANGNITLTAALSDISLNSPLTAGTAGNTITLTATVGAITDGNGNSGNVVATNFAASAGTGIGTALDPIETSVSNIEARTVTGGIFLANSGATLNIGGVTANFAGVQATTSGDIVLTNNASIILGGNGAEDIRAVIGNVLVQAIGATSNIETRNNNADGIDSDNGSVTLDAGQDILLGSAAVDVFGDIEANGNLLLTAGRDLIVDENTFVDAFGSGTLTVAAGRNVSIVASDGTTGSRLTTASGAISITTGVGGTFTADSNNTNAISSSSSGSITINADIVNITAGDGISAGTGIVTIQPVTAGRFIDLGSATDVAANTLELSDAELDRIIAGTLRIGSATAGTITVTAAISAANTATLALVTGGAITASGSITETNLRLSAFVSIVLNGANDVDTLAGGTGNFFFNDSDGFLIGTVDGVAGVSSEDTLSLTAGAVTQDVGANIITPSLVLLGTGPFTLNNPGNSTGILTANTTGALSYTDINALILGTSSVGTGTFDITAVGITQTGALTQAAGAGAATFNAGAGVITLTQANDFTGLVSLTNSGANSVAIRDINALALGASSVGSGTLGINAVGITQTGALTQSAGAGAATFNGGAGVITLTQANNFTGDVSLNNSGANNVAVTDINGIVLGASSVGSGTLGITAISIFQNGALVQAAGAGAATFNGGAGGISLTEDNDFTGPVTLNNTGANNVFVTDINALILSASSIGTGTLSVHGVGITQTGAITQAAGAGTAFFTSGAGVITLTQANNFTGSVFLSNSGANNVAVTSINPITLFACGVGSGTLTINAPGITQALAITQEAGAGAAIFNGGAGEITLTNPGNDFTGPVTLNNSGANNAAIADANDLVLTAHSIAQLLDITATGAVTQTGAFTGAGGVTFHGSGTLTLSATNTYAGTTTVSGGTLNGTGSITSRLQIDSGATLAPGTSPGIFSSANATFASGSNFTIEINGTTAGSGFDQLAVTGSVNLGSATLSATTNIVPAPDSEFVIISNDGVDAVTGIFVGLPEGEPVTLSGRAFNITYTGGDGNDVALTTLPPLTVQLSVDKKSATFTDVDGDHVTVKASKGLFNGSEFTGVEMGANGAGQLQKLQLGAAFKGANITITAKPTVNGGNGFVNIGFIDASGVDLGLVTIPGDVGRIAAGTVGGDVKVPGIKSLIAQTLGILGTSTQGFGGSIGTVIEGALPKFIVKGDLRTSLTLNGVTDGKLGAASIGGTFTVSTDGGNTLISAAAGIGSLKFGGDIRSTTTASVGITTAGPIGTLSVGGSIVGTSASNVQISAFGKLISPTLGVDNAIKNLTVKGSVEFTSINLGSPGGSTNADASLGVLTVGGDWIASTVLAGSTIGADLVAGTADDAKIAGATRDTAARSTIGSFTVKGQALGTAGTTTDMFGIVAEKIVKAKVGGRTFAFTNGATPEAFFAAPTLDGEGTENPMFDFTIRELGSTTPTVAFTLDFTLSADNKTATYTDVDGDLVTVKRDVGTFVLGDFTIVTAASGGGLLQQLNVTPAPNNAATNLSITAKVGPGAGNGFVNVGKIRADQTDLGTVVIAGELQDLDVGDNSATRIGLGSLTVQSLGKVAGTAPSGDEINSAHGIGKITVKTDVRQFSIFANNQDSGKLGNITIGGSVVGGTIQAAANIGTIKIGGSFRGDGKIQATKRIGAITVGGDLIGSGGTAATIEAFAQSAGPALGLDLALKSLTVKGNVENTNVILGRNNNADASIGPISVGRSWLASSVLAGVTAGTDTFIGTADDAKVTAGGPIDVAGRFSTIASIVIKGQALGSSAGGDSFGIVAERIVKAKIGTRSFAFKAPTLLAPNREAFAAAPTAPGVSGLPFDFFIREVSL